MRSIRVSCHNNVTCLYLPYCISSVTWHYMNFNNSVKIGIILSGALYVTLVWNLRSYAGSSNSSASLYHTDPPPPPYLCSITTWQTELFRLCRATVGKLNRAILLNGTRWEEEERMTDATVPSAGGQWNVKAHVECVCSVWQFVRAADGKRGMKCNLLTNSL